MFISHPKVPFTTRLIAISGTTIGMDHNATGTVTGSAARFSPIVDAQTMGSTGGTLSQTTTLVTANLPAYTPSGTVGLSLAATFPVQGTFGGSEVTNAALFGANNGPVRLCRHFHDSIRRLHGISTGGTSAPIVRPNVQPTIVMNYIIKR